MDSIVINEKSFRVEVNWNAIVAFLETSGRDDVRELMGLSSLKPSDLAGLLAAAINEGERLEGRDCKFTAEEIGAMADFDTMAQFIQIFAKQTAPRGVEKEPKKEGPTA